MFAQIGAVCILRFFPKQGQGFNPSPRFIYTPNIGQVTRPPLLGRILNKGSTYTENNH